MTDEPELAFHPLTPERWPGLEALFGKRGACAGCWCMFWRQTSRQFEEMAGENNRRMLKAIVDDGEKPGILAYSEEQPVGWCAVAPWERYVRLEHSRVLKKVDDEPVWTIPCFFVARAFRHKGVTRALLREAVEFARQNGAKIVEGYPIVPKKDKVPDVFAYTGFFTAFQAAGFIEVARRSETRPIMRFYV